MSLISLIDWKLKNPEYLRRQAHEMSGGTCSNRDLDTGVKNLGYPADEQEDDSGADANSGDYDD